MISRYFDFLVMLDQKVLINTYFFAASTLRIKKRKRQKKTKGKGVKKPFLFPKTKPPQKWLFRFQVFRETGMSIMSIIKCLCTKD